MKCRRCTGVCFYCDMPLSKRHEHDHFPVPQRAGGTQTVGACINCHDLKDRLPWDEWMDGESAALTVKGLPPTARILMAKLFYLAVDSGLVTTCAEKPKKAASQG